MTNNRSSLRLLVVTIRLIAGFGITSAFAGGSAEEAVPDNELRVGFHSKPVSLDPHYDTSGSIMPIQRAIHEPLIKLDYDAEYIPWLATSWEQVDDTTWRLELREGVQYHSGNPFNAEAVKAFFDRTFDPADEGRRRGWIPNIVGAEVVDEYTVDILADVPHAGFLGDLTRIHIHITDAVRAAELGEEHGRNPSGTGPFVFDEWRPGEYIRLVSNENYWGGGPHVDVLEFRFIPEASTRVTALELGEIDIAWEVPPHEADRIETTGVDGVQIDTAGTARPMVYYMNSHPDHPVLGDPRVRRAIAYAIDNEVIAEMLGRLADPLEGFLGSGVWGFDPNYNQGHQPERAAELMREAGWELETIDGGGRRFDVWVRQEDGQRLDLTLTHPNFWPLQNEVAEQVLAQLTGFGAFVSIQTIDRALHWDISEQAVHGDPDVVPPYDMYFSGNGRRTRDGNANLQDTYASWGVSNRPQWNNEEFDAYIERARLGLDRPIHIQYFSFVGNLLQGDFGISYRSRMPVSTVLLPAFRATVHLAIVTMMITATVGISIGILAATNRGKLLDQIAMSVTMVGISSPAFFVGILLMYVFAYQLRWFPSSGARQRNSVILPALTIGLHFGAMLEVLGEGYIRTAGAKGLAPKWVHCKHALRNAALPVVTLLGLQAGHILGGAIVAETILARPGIGRLLLNAIEWRDVPIVQGGVVIIALVFSIITLLVDLLYAWLNPSIRYN